MYQQIMVRDIIFQMLQERSQEAEKDIQNYLGELIIADYKSKEKQHGKDH